MALKLPRQTIMQRFNFIKRLVPTGRARIRRISLLVTIVGIASVSFGTVISSCSPTDSLAATQSLQQPLGEARAPVAEAIRIWDEENGPDGDPFSAGVAAWKIANATHDVKWAREAIRRLETARQDMPQFAQATAWLGSAHALIARDYPLRGAWQVIPGPGFVRIHHVRKAERLLDSAVAQAPNDPAVRLTRATTVLGMPRLLVDHANAYADLEHMAEWIIDPASNPAHAQILNSGEWLERFDTVYAQALDSEGMTSFALATCRQLRAQGRNSGDHCP